MREHPAGYLGPCFTWRRSLVFWICLAQLLCACQSDLAARLADLNVDENIDAGSDDTAGGGEAPDAGDDACPTDPEKLTPGVCGCGVADRDRDADGALDCAEECPNDPQKLAAGVCGCGVADADAVNAADCVDACPDDPNKSAPGECGCGVADSDDDEDGTPDCDDACPFDANKVVTGMCGCGVSETDSDLDQVPDCRDACPADATKAAAGACGCGVPDVDSDADGVFDCMDACPNDANSTELGVCGCDEAEVDEDEDGVPDCVDACVGEANNARADAGASCGCGDAAQDADEDGVADCADECPSDPQKAAPGACGCGEPDLDSDEDGVRDCVDECPEDPGQSEPGPCGCGVADTDTDLDGTPDCNDACPEDTNKLLPGECGCAVAESGDSDDDGTLDCNDDCPADALKTVPGVCGCGYSDESGDATTSLCSGLLSTLAHRYSFNGGAMLAQDSVGDAHGLLNGTSLPGNGTVELSGGSYVNLPDNVIADLANLTFEAWFTREADGTWQRLFDFGNSDSGTEGQPGAQGTSYVFLAPQMGGVMRFGFRPNGGNETAFDLGAASALGVLEHVAVVLNDADNSIAGYRNGAPGGSVTWTGSMSQITTLNNWLGRSQYASDPAYVGSISEFRIYSSALSAEHVQYSFAAGQEPAYLDL